MNVPTIGVVDHEKAVQALGLLEKVSSEFSSLDDCCYYAHVTTEIPWQHEELFHHMVKIEGSIMIVLVKGRLQIEMNTESFTVEGPSAVALHHGTLVKIHPNEHQQIDAYLLIYTLPFLHDINISFSVIWPEALMNHTTPMLELSEREVPLLLRYYGLIHNVMHDSFNPRLTRHIVSSLTTAMFYQVLVLLYKSIEVRDVDNSGSRRSSYVHDFMRLVHLHYTRERSVNFYASQLFISPKYLSLLVKEATGRSAARWIDHFVITEAKNLLRFSGKNVQQVAYALNFSNQSSFGKYFKHLTGMSPTEYQKQ